MNTHPGTTCSVCGKQLAFIEYGEKLGKDGRVAKWPIYEKCTKENHVKGEHKKLTAKRAEYLPVDAPLLEVIDNPIRLVDGRSGPKGRLYQLPKMSVEHLPTIVNLFEKVTGMAPAKALIHQDDLETLGPVNGWLEIEPTDKITPGYRYIFLQYPTG